tara:strand:- start:5872 stop:6381 length:510 start_codon:yes stop_codon:yes gene_type:complete
MNLQELKNNPVLKELVENIICDDTFMNKCDTHFKQIFEDGKIDGDDVPIIISLVMTIYNNHNKLKIKKENMKPFLLLLIGTLIDKFKMDNIVDETLIMALLEPQIDLLLMSITTAKNLSCCSSRPTKETVDASEEHLVNKMKLKKLEQQIEKSKGKVVRMKIKNEKIIP